MGDGQFEQRQIHEDLPAVHADVFYRSDHFCRGYHSRGRIPFQYMDPHRRRARFHRSSSAVRPAMRAGGRFCSSAVNVLHKFETEEQSIVTSSFPSLLHILSISSSVL